MSVPLVALVALALAALQDAPREPAPDELPVFIVRRDDTRIGRSCRLTFFPGQPIRDANGDGVVHIVASGIRIEFVDGAELWGAAPGTPGDALSGIGIRIVGQKDVTIAGARIAGFKAAIHATDCDGLVIEDADLSGNFRQRLRSTPRAEDGADWITPHHNDQNEWLERYGAALYVEDSSGVTIRRNRVRRGQNGIVLDRVTHSFVYDNDASFLSGWGLAMWRSSDNIIDHNAFDFCVRGYSHGVYNRGQDSAGILMFEQCSRNVIARNSATHGGDGIFAFAGREALGEGAIPEGFDHRGAGNNRNQFMHNDLSFAPAHGLELTFSFDNLVVGNLFEGNAICGIWGGYSQRTRIRENRFIANGDAGYGLERGGVNIEHGLHNEIEANVFERNACGVHLWWDADEHIAKLPWARANGVASDGNTIVDNSFQGDALALHLRQAGSTNLYRNQFEDVGEELRAEESEVVSTSGDEEILFDPSWPEVELRGATRPVGARQELRGREHIVMTEWGPWDNAGPLVRLWRTGRSMRTLGTANSHYDTYDIYQVLACPDGIKARVVSGEVEASIGTLTDTGEVVGAIVDVWPDRAGVVPYVLVLEGGCLEAPVELRGSISNFTWDARFFAWTTDPREDADAWRAEADEGAVVKWLDVLDLPFGSGGPSQLELRGPPGGATLPTDRFGTLASATVHLPAGRWRIITVSDDGIRVRADGELIIDNWTWHAPTRDEAVLELAEAREVALEVEHFELDGWAVLSLVIEAAD